MLCGFCLAGGGLVFGLFLQAQCLNLVGVFTKLGNDLFLDRQHGVVEVPLGGGGVSRGGRVCPRWLPSSIQEKCQMGKRVFIVSKQKLLRHGGIWRWSLLSHIDIYYKRIPKVRFVPPIF